MVMALSVRELSVGHAGGGRLLDRVSFDLAPGARLGLVGASGSGKSLTAAALCGLLRPPLGVTGGSAQLDGRELLSLSPRGWRGVRGRGVFQIFQSPGVALSPARRIGAQLAETACLAGADPRAAPPQALDKVLLERGVADLFPYQLSGGMKQRVLIAMALILRPLVLIADEPTTGLDVETEAEILAALRVMVDETQAALLFISHDLRAVQAVAENALVMEAGRIAASASITSLAASPSPAARRLAEAAEALAAAC